MALTGAVNAGSPDTRALLDHLTKQARSDDPKAVPAVLAAEGVCGLAITIDGSAEQHCRWAYPYRAPEGRAKLVALAAEITDGLGAQATKVQPGVNHPDSYDQLLFRLDDLQISLSLKDKAALHQSFVFLRVSTASDER